TIDDDAITYTWTQTGGDAVTLEGADSADLVLRNLAPGSYRFSVLAVDADGQFDADEVAVEVEQATEPATTGDDESSTGDSAVTSPVGEDSSTGDLPGEGETQAATETSPIGEETSS